MKHYDLMFIMRKVTSDGVGKFFPPKRPRRSLRKPNYAQPRRIADHIQITDETATVLHALRVADVVEASFSPRD
jgi:hypothetical protein